MNSKTGFYMKIIFAVIFLIFFLGSNLLANKTYASDTSLLTNLNNPTVLIFLDTSGSMMWNEGVVWSGSGGNGYDAPESWADGGASHVWAPGSNSVFSKIYNAKMAISEIVNDPAFSNLNFAFATFDQTPSPNSGKQQTNACVYAYGPSPYDGLTFTNPANAAYYPGNPGGSGTPDHSGAYLINNSFNSEYPFEGANGPYGNGIYPCSGPSNLDAKGNPTTNLNDIAWYFISYDYSFYIGDDDNQSGLSNWRLYIPLTVNGTLNTTTSETVASNSNNSTDPYFDPSNIAGPAINYVLWDAHDYGSLEDPAGSVVSGLKAGGGTPMYSMVENMITYFTNSLGADSAKACRRNFSIIITDGEANGYNASLPSPSPPPPASALYNLYTNVDTTYPIETFMIGFGYSGSVGGPSYIQIMANAGAGIDPSANPSGVSFTAAAGSSSTAYTLPSAAFSTTNGVVVGDTVSDNGWQSSDCEENNISSTGEPSGIYSSAGFDCAVVTGIYPNTDTVLLSNPLSHFSGTLTVSGTVYLTFNYSELVNSLTTIFNQIEAQSTSFTSPVVHQVNAGNGNVYYADFKALNQPLWGEGNIFLFKLNSQGQLTGPNGSAVSTGGQIITSDSYWGINGSGAGGELQTESPASRYVTTSETNPSTGLNETIPFNVSNVSNLESLLGLNSTNYTSVCPGSASESACADDIINFVLNPDSATDNWKLGAIFHSDPVLISPPSYPYSSLSYPSFKSQYAERQMVLVVGANDGMLHGFDAGTWDSSTSSFTDGTGSELFGYIPPDFLDTNGSSSLPKITSWYETSVTQPSIYEFVDSTPSVNDTFFGNIFNGTANSVDASAYPISSSGTPVSSWHTVLVGGERDGGTSYYALDLTNPSGLGSGYPTGLWDFSDASASTDPMGYTWSKPLITYVCLPNPNYSSTKGGTGICGNDPNQQSPVAAPEYIKTYTAFIGGGYSSNNTAGQAVYALYVEPNPVNTGTSSAPDYVDEQELWKFDGANDSHMTYSIPSSISPVESSDFMLQAFYVGDLGGQMWAFNIPFGEPPQGSGNKQNWTGCRVFASNQTSPPLNIFFPPAISYDASGNLWLYFGTGNRENLTEVIAARDNELIGLNTAGTQGTGECAASGGPYSEANLTNATGTSGIGTLPSSSAGWYINLSQGEKVVGTAQVYDGIVYFATYTPSATANACGYGTANLYAVYYLNGGGTITTSGGTATISNTAGAGASQSMVIGSGVPSAPVISNGNLIITTSTGAVLTQKIPSLPSKLIPTSWFQLP